MIVVGAFGRRGQSGRGRLDLGPSGYKIVLARVLRNPPPPLLFHAMGATPARHLIPTPRSRRRRTLATVKASAVPTRQPFPPRRLLPPEPDRARVRLQRHAGGLEGQGSDPEADAWPR